MDDETHEHEEKKKKDEIKNSLLELAGLPIQRLKTYEKNPLRGIRFHKLTKEEKRNELLKALITFREAKCLSESREYLKPIFINSDMVNYYNLLNETFRSSQYAVFPRVALQAMFLDEAIKSVPEHSQKDCCFKSTVDFCIVSTKSFLPMIAFDIDKEDEIKKRVFKYFEFPLLQLPKWSNRI